MMTKLLVPTDFSETSENATHYAIEMANALSAEIVLLHVNQIPVSVPEFGITAFDVSEMKTDSLITLKELAEKIKHSHPNISKIEYYAEIGNSADVILEYAKNKKFEFVIMGNNGHGNNFIKNIIGSTSVSVSKKIEAPLIIVPPHVKYKKIENLAYASVYDADIETNKAISKVRDLNLLFNSTLSVLHVIPENHSLNEQESFVDNFVESKLAKTEHRTYIITENKVSVGILDFVKCHEIDMIIVEPKKHSIFHTLFYPSITNELAFKSPVPVLTIHS
jgi:nucleotide-binding universal stress UspA family protein